MSDPEVTQALSRMSFLAAPSKCNMTTVLYSPAHPKY